MPHSNLQSSLPSKARPPRTLILMCTGIGFILLGMSELAFGHIDSHRVYSAKIVAMQAQDSGDAGTDGP